MDEAAEGSPSLHPVPENADLNAPEKPMLGCKSYGGIFASLTTHKAITQITPRRNRHADVRS